MVTSLFSGILGILLFIISLMTIRQRRKRKISLGTGANNEISAIVSAHSNFVSYVPMFLVLMYLTESAHRLNILIIYLLGGIFTLGRVLHFLAFKGEKMNFRMRVAGMIMTLWPILIFSILNAYLWLM